MGLSIKLVVHSGLQREGISGYSNPWYAGGSSQNEIPKPRAHGRNASCFLAVKQASTC